jgi:hypothetical protein
MQFKMRRSLAALFVCLCAIALFARARSQGPGPLAPGVANAQQLVAALNLYVEDWDETYPPMRTQPQFQTALTNYVSSPAIFVCPITNKPYQPNPALSGKSTASVTDIGSTAAVSAAIPGQSPLVAYLDSHVQQGRTDLTDPTQESVQNAKSIAQGLLLYTQDWDEVFPPSQTLAQFQKAIAPYVHDRHALTCPLSGKPFQLNPQLKGETLAAIADYGTTPAIWDTPTKPNNRSVIGYLQEGDDHVRSLILGLEEYTQDYDEILPPMQSPAIFKQVVYPYIRSERVFLDPYSQQPYLPNPFLSGKPLAKFPDYSAVYAFMASAPGPDKRITVGYLDDYITRSGIDQGDPTFETTQHARQLTLGMQLYMQDYDDDSLPPMANWDQFKAAMMPYLRRSRAFVAPYNHTRFVINTALNGHKRSDFSDPSKIVVFYDPFPERDGRPTVGYLDGHVTPNRYMPRP